MRYLEFKREWGQEANPLLVSIHHPVNRLACNAALGVECDDDGVGFEFDRTQAQGLGLEPHLHDFE